MNERDIADAVRTGERNKEVRELVYNWCSHARIVNAGGVGLIAIETGLPIGMLGIECDHAPVGGVASWYLEVSALDFHDRNCAHCGKRAAVRVPNLSTLVGERDRQRARQKKEEGEARTEASAARARRRQRRDALRAGQSAAICALLDDVQALDDGASPSAGARVVETARLAPEIFTPPIIEYFFELAVSREICCQPEALEVLKCVGADSKRLIATALACLATSQAIDVAAAIFLANPELGDETDVFNAVPTLVSLAKPSSSGFHGIEIQHQPRPLAVAYQARPVAVTRGIQRLLDSQRPYSVRMGTSALEVLREINPRIHTEFGRTLVAKLARTHLLMNAADFDDGLNEACMDLQQAVAWTLIAEPEATDRLILDFFSGASSDGEGRLAGAYLQVAQLASLEKAEIDETVASVVVRRMVNWSASSRNSEVLSAVRQTFQHPPAEVVSATMRHLDLLLGAVAMVHDRIEMPESSVLARAGDANLDAVERHSMALTMRSLRAGLAEAAAMAASNSVQATEAYMDFVGKVDESRDGLSAVLLKQVHRLVETPEALNIALPHLYTSLVGASVAKRGMAAYALGHMKKERIGDLPELVLEAFVVQLLDQYNYVHQHAADALANVRLPDDLESKAGTALFAAILAYRGKADSEEFMLRCMALYLDRFCEPDSLKNGFAAIFLLILQEVSTYAHLQAFHRMSRHLKWHPSYVDLVLRVLEDTRVTDSGEETAVSLVYLLPDAEVVRRADDLVKSTIRQPDRARICGSIVEVLTRAGAWDHAVTVAEASWRQVPETLPKRRRKWNRRMHLVAARFEAAVKTGDTKLLAALKIEWHGLVKALDDDDKQYAQRRDSFPDLYFPN